MRRVLLLNATYEPLKFIGDKKAMALVLKDRASIAQNLTGLPSVWCGLFFTTVTAEFEVPATLRLHRRVKVTRRLPKFRKKVLFNRDGWRCQYCGCRVNRETAEVEHVVPVSRGGGSSWSNCTTSCRPCNKSKADRTPEEAGMTLKASPKTPHALHFWDVLRCDEWHDDWDMYVPAGVVKRRISTRCESADAGILA